MQEINLRLNDITDHLSPSHLDSQSLDQRLDTLTGLSKDLHILIESVDQAEHQCKEQCLATPQEFSSIHDRILSIESEIQQRLNLTQIEADETAKKVEEEKSRLKAEIASLSQRLDTILESAETPAPEATPVHQISLLDAHLQTLGQLELEFVEYLKVADALGPRIDVLDEDVEKKLALTKEKVQQRLEQCKGDQEKTVTDLQRSIVKLREDIAQAQDQTSVSILSHLSPDEKLAVVQSLLKLLEDEYSVRLHEILRRSETTGINVERELRDTAEAIGNLKLHCLELQQSIQQEQAQQKVVEEEFSRQVEWLRQKLQETKAELHQCQGQTLADRLPLLEHLVVTAEELHEDLKPIASKAEAMSISHFDSTLEQEIWTLVTECRAGLDTCRQEQTEAQQKIDRDLNDVKAAVLEISKIAKEEPLPILEVALNQLRGYEEQLSGLACLAEQSGLPLTENFVAATNALAETKNQLSSSIDSSRSAQDEQLKRFNQTLGEIHELHLRLDKDRLSALALDDRLSTVKEVQFQLAQLEPLVHHAPATIRPELEANIVLVQTDASLMAIELERLELLAEMQNIVKEANLTKRISALEGIVFRFDDLLVETVNCGHAEKINRTELEEDLKKSKEQIMIVLNANMEAMAAIENSVSNEFLTLQLALKDAVVPSGDEWTSKPVDRRLDVLHDKSNRLNSLSRKVDDLADVVKNFSLTALIQDVEGLKGQIASAKEDLRKHIQDTATEKRQKEHYEKLEKQKEAHLKLSAIEQELSGLMEPINEESLAQIPLEQRLQHLGHTLSPLITMQQELQDLAEALGHTENLVSLSTRITEATNRVQALIAEAQKEEDARLKVSDDLLEKIKEQQLRLHSGDLNSLPLEDRIASVKEIQYQLGLLEPSIGEAPETTRHQLEENLTTAQLEVSLKSIELEVEELANETRNIENEANLSKRVAALQIVVRRFDDLLHDLTKIELAKPDESSAPVEVELHKARETALIALETNQKTKNKIEAALRHDYEILKDSIAKVPEIENNASWTSLPVDQRLDILYETTTRLHSLRRQLEDAADVAQNLEIIDLCDDMAIVKEQITRILDDLKVKTQDTATEKCSRDQEAVAAEKAALERLEKEQDELRQEIDQITSEIEYLAATIGTIDTSSLPIEEREAWWRSFIELAQKLRDRFNSLCAKTQNRGYVIDQRSILLQITSLEQQGAEKLKEAALGPKREKFVQDLASIEKSIESIKNRLQDENLAQLSFADRDQLLHSIHEELTSHLEPYHQKIQTEAASLGLSLPDLSFLFDLIRQRVAIIEMEKSKKQNEVLYLIGSAENYLTEAENQMTQLEDPSDSTLDSKLAQVHSCKAILDKVSGDQLPVLEQLSSYVYDGDHVVSALKNRLSNTRSKLDELEHSISTAAALKQQHDDQAEAIKKDLQGISSSLEEVEETLTQEAALNDLRLCETKLKETHDKLGSIQNAGLATDLQKKADEAVHKCQVRVVWSLYRTSF